MAGGIEGERPRGEPTSSQKQNSPEAGAGPLGLPPPSGPEQQPQQESQERQPLPSVWEVLENRARIHEEHSSGRITNEEYGRERRKLIRLENEIYEKGTPRDNLIFDLHSAVTMEPTGTLPDPVRFRELSLEEYHQFRSRAEPLNEEELVGEIRKADEEFERKKKANTSPPFPAGGAATV